MTQEMPGSRMRQRPRLRQRANRVDAGHHLTGGISMWGTPSSGKTTFASALAVALENHSDEPWRLRGVDQRGSDALGSMLSAIVDRGEFPTATTNKADYNWELVNPDPRAGQVGAFGLRRRDRTRRVPLHLHEGAGGYHDPNQWGRGDAQALLDAMATCGGFVFLYDPVSEHAEGNSFRHTGALLKRLDHLLGDGPGGYLPQYLALCVAKFDDFKVYRSAQKAGFLDYRYEEDGSPYVPDEQAQEFFEMMCRVSRHPATWDLPRLLSRYFSPRRTRVFVSSAIGFNINPKTNLFDHDDPMNVIPGSQREMTTIRGTIRPINVMEPVLWLADNLKKAQP